MAGQTFLWDSRIKTVAVMLPALGLLTWIASEVASEDFLVPGVLLGVFVVLVVFTVFVKTVRFEAAVLCVLVLGYLVGNRGFADLSVVKPLYPGEFGIAVIGTCVLFRFALTRELPDMSGWYARVIFVYCGLGAVRLGLDYKTYKLDALRDSAMVYYAAFFFFSRQLAAQPSSKRLLERAISVAYLLLVPIAILYRVAPDTFLSSGGGMTLLFQKDDLLTTFAAMGVYLIYTRPRMYYWNWLRVALILFYMAYVVSGVGRASLAALVLGSIPIFVAGKRRFVLYPIVAVILGITVLAGLAGTFGSSRASDPLVLVEKVSSMLDYSGTGSYGSDYGDQKAATNDFRRKLWAAFIDETNAKGPVFGCGFGYDFVVRFVEEYRLGEEGGLRSAHNFYVTLYGRMGWVGIGVFAVLTMQIVVGGLRAAWQVRAGRQPLEDLGYWIVTWVVLVSSVVGVVLEGPVGAIVFWVFLGVAVESSQRAKETWQREHSHHHGHALLPVVSLPERRAVSYGVT